MFHCDSLILIRKSDSRAIAMEAAGAAKAARAPTAKPFVWAAPIAITTSLILGMVVRRRDRCQTDATFRPVAIDVDQENLLEGVGRRAPAARVQLQPVAVLFISLSQ